MTIVTEGLLGEVYFGFDRERLLVRIDTAKDAVDDLAGVEQLRLRFHEPDGYEVRVTGLNVRQPRAKLYQDDKPVTKAKVDVAVGPIFELSLRLADIDRKPHDPIHFAIEAMARKNSLDRAPREGSIELRCPTEDFELVMWQA
jgi:hypothetical protein